MDSKKNLKFELQNFQKSCLSLFALDLLTGAGNIQEQAERERLAKEYIYDPSHSEEQAALFLDAAGTEEWTLEDLRTLAAQSDIDSMKILQRKIEQLHKASQKKK